MVWALIIVELVVIYLLTCLWISVQRASHAGHLVLKWQPNFEWWLGRDVAVFLALKERCETHLSHLSPRQRAVAVRKLYQQALAGRSEVATL